MATTAPTLPDAPGIFGPDAGGWRQRWMLSWDHGNEAPRERIGSGMGDVTGP